MQEGGHPLVPTYNGEPDLWNTKPPLMIWMQVGMMKLFDPGELAVRFPSAIAGLLTVLLVFFFISYYLKDPLTGFLAGLILLSSKGFIIEHAARHGDYDALLVLWLTLAFLSYFIFLQTKDTGRSKIIYVTIISLTLAVLTKGVAGLLILPALFISTILFKKIRPVFSNVHFYIGLVIFTGSIISYYLLRENVNPGYLQAMIENEISGRYLETDDKQPFLFYFKWLFTTYWVPWIFLSPIFIWIFFRGNKLERKLCLYLLIYVIIFLLILSLSETKNTWYANPVYPALAILLSINLSKGIEWVLEKFLVNSYRNKLILVVMIAAGPVIAIFLINQHKIHSKHPDLQYRSVLSEINRSEFKPELIKILHPVYNPSLDFYIKYFDKKGMAFERLYIYHQHEFTPSELILSCKPEHQKTLEDVNQFEILLENNGCRLYRIR